MSRTVPRIVAVTMRRGTPPPLLTKQDMADPLETPMERRKRNKSFRASPTKTYIKRRRLLDVDVLWNYLDNEDYLTVTRHTVQAYQGVEELIKAKEHDWYCAFCCSILDNTYCRKLDCMELSLNHGLSVYPKEKQ